MGAFPEKRGSIEFPSNRYEALDEAHRLLKTNQIDLVRVSEVLRKSVDGRLAFCFGDVSIVFLRDSEEYENLIHMSIAVEKGGMRRIVSFEYEMGNLGL